MSSRAFRRLQEQEQKKKAEAGEAIDVEENVEPIDDQEINCVKKKKKQKQKKVNLFDLVSRNEFVSLFCCLNFQRSKLTIVIFNVKNPNSFYKIHLKFENLKIFNQSTLQFTVYYISFKIQ